MREQIAEQEKALGIITCKIFDAETGKLKRVYKQKNTIMLAGRCVQTRRLANETTYTGIINYGVLFTGSPATENHRNTVFSNTYDDADARALLSFVFGKTEVAGTFTKFQTVIDGTGSAGTGQVWTEVDVNWVKTNQETMTIECEYQLLAA
jgi:hypothetical protein